MATKTPTRLYDQAAIAEALGVDSGRVRVWKSRGLLPDPDFIVGRSPAWSERVIGDWLKNRAATLKPPTP